MQRPNDCILCHLQYQSDQNGIFVTFFFFEVYPDRDFSSPVIVELRDDLATGCVENNGKLIVNVTERKSEDMKNINS